MKCGVEARDLRERRAQRFQRPYRRNIVRLVQRGHGVEALQRIDYRVIDTHRLEKPLTSVHDAMPGRRDIASVAARFQPVEEPPRRGF